MDGEHTKVGYRKVAGRDLLHPLWYAINALLLLYSGNHNLATAATYCVTAVQNKSNSTSCISV